MKGEITKIIVEVDGKQYKATFSAKPNDCNNCDLHDVCHNNLELDGTIICAQIANIIDYSLNNFKEIKQ